MRLFDNDLRDNRNQWDDKLLFDRVTCVMIQTRHCCRHILMQVCILMLKSSSRRSLPERRRHKAWSDPKSPGRLEDVEDGPGHDNTARIEPIRKRQNMEENDGGHPEKSDSTKSLRLKKLLNSMMAFSKIRLSGFSGCLHTFPTSQPKELQDSLASEFPSIHYTMPSTVHFVET